MSHLVDTSDTDCFLSSGVYEFHLHHWTLIPAGTRWMFTFMSLCSSQILPQKQQILPEKSACADSGTRYSFKSTQSESQPCSLITKTVATNQESKISRDWVSKWNTILEFQSWICMMYLHVNRKNEIKSKLTVAKDSECSCLLETYLDFCFRYRCMYT